MAENSETISQRISATRSRQHRQLQFCCQQQRQHDGPEQEQHHHQKPHRRHHHHRQHHSTMLKMMLLIACCSYALLPTAALAKGYHDDHGGGGGIGDPMEVAARTSDGDSAEASVEILPAPRFRHQEHYEHRIEQAVNDFKRQQQLQLQREVPSASGGGNKEPLPKKTATMPPEHHRRHEHKLQQKVLEFKRQEPYSPPPQQHEEPHHVRHHHNHIGINKNNRNHNDQTHGNALPPLRHHRHHQLERLHQLPLQQQQLQHNRKQQQQHIDSMSISDSSSSSSSLINADDDIIQSSKSPGGRPYYAVASLPPQPPNGTSTANGNKTTKPSRYFDRDGLYVADTPAVGSKDWRWKSLSPRTTEGPLIVSSPLDSAEEEDDDDEESKHEGSSRYSLKFLPDDEDNNNNYDDYDDTDKDEKPVGNGDDDDDGDNYSYEDDAPEENNKLQTNEFPGSFSASAAKASVKRFTNPFRQNDKNRRSASSNGYTPQDQLDRFEYKHYEHKRQREMQTRDAVKWQQQQLQHDAANELESIHSASYQKGKLTAYKQSKLGSPEGVRNDRVEYHNHKAKAIAHNKLVMREGSCRVPQRRFLRIQRDLSKIYMPHYTMLYRCADDTGCCRSERETCGPKHTENVDMYFHVKSINSNKFHVESLTFVNHTECHCIDRIELQQQQQQQQQSQQIQMEPALAEYARRRSPPTRHASIFSCNCPKMFEKILQDNGQCRCDCSSGNTDCDYLKRGQEHFSMNDRICILEGRCKVPICEYGPYKKEYGCCPKFAEKHSIGFNQSGDGGSEAAKSSRKLFASNGLPSHKYR